MKWMVRALFKTIHFAHYVRSVAATHLYVRTVAATHRIEYCLTNVCRVVMSSPFDFAQDKLRQGTLIPAKLAFRSQPDLSARLRLGRDDKWGGFASVEMTSGVTSPRSR
jgi:hypothetical protein